MAWIELIPEETATGELKALYKEIRPRRGKISNILAVHSLHPGALRAHLELYLQVMFARSGLSRAERELIAVVVSAANQCTCCMQHHAEALKAYWKDAARVAQAVENYRKLKLPERPPALAGSCGRANTRTRSGGRSRSAATASSGMDRSRSVSADLDRGILQPCQSHCAGPGRSTSAGRGARVSILRCSALALPVENHSQSPPGVLVNQWNFYSEALSNPR